MKRFFVMATVLVLGLLVFSCKSPVRQASAPDYQMTYDVSDVTFEMVKIPAGYMTMGISADNRRKVTGGVALPVILDGYVISQHPVSHALWTAVMGKAPGSAGGPESPVDMVSWNDAQKFIAKLNKLTGKVFSLPTEAQWEYAQKTLGKENFTVAGEWCSDTFAEEGSEYYETREPRRNPQGPAEGDLKVIRTINERIGVDCHTSKAKVGFRLVQPTEEAIDPSFLEALTGYTIDREKTDASAGGAEEFSVGDVKFRMVKVKGGEYTMGFQNSDSPYLNFNVPENEQPAHKVTLDDFATGETEVTVALWNAVMGSVPYLNDIKDADKAVGNVSWYNAQVFLKKLNEMTGRKFRLPTEAEWEYAARGGRKSRRYGFSGSNDMNPVMWNADNSDNEIHDVAGKKANELGLYDMSGNVWEWCYDRYEMYKDEPQVNPVGAMEQGNRTMRGGSYASRWNACRISNRSNMPPKNIKGSFGLRLAL